MAELGLAIAGVAATGAALSKALFSIYHSVHGASRDVRDIATELEILKSVLRQLIRTIRKNESVYSSNAVSDIRRILERCTQIFNGLEDITAPLRSADGDPLLHPKLGDRLKFHFKKDDLRLLKIQLESIKSTIGLMISTILLNRELPVLSSEDDEDRTTSVRLTSALSVASEHVRGERACLTNLMLIEEDVYANATHELKYARISLWLTEIVGMGGQGGAPSASQSTMSHRSNRTLSAAQRSITGAATSDVEMLLEKWTNSGESRRSGSSCDVQSKRGPRSSRAGSNRSQGADEEPLAAAVPLNHPTCADQSIQEAQITPETTQSEKAKQATDSEAEEESNSQAESDSTVEENRYHATAKTSSSNSSSTGSTSTITSCAADIQPNHSQTIPLTPILVSHGDDVDNDTVRDLRRASLNNRRVRINAPDLTTDPQENYSRVKDWVASNVVLDETGGDVPMQPGQTKNNPYQYHTPFSQISILSSQAPSTVSSISTTTDMSSPKKIRNLVWAGKNLVQLRRYAEAASLFREAYKIKRAASQVDDAQMLDIMFKIGIVFGELGKYLSAERMLVRLLVKQQELFGTEEKQTHLTRHYLGRIYSRQQEWHKASETYQSLWNARKIALQELDPTASRLDLALRTGQEYGHVLVALESFEKATEILTLVYQTSKKSRGDGDIKITLATGISLGRALRSMGRVTDSCEVLVSLHESCSSNLSVEDPTSIRCTYELAAGYLDGKMFRECEVIARPAWDARTTTQSLTDPTGPNDLVLELGETLARALRGLNRNNEAAEVFKVVHQGLVARYSQSHPRAIKITLELSEILLQQAEEYEAQTQLNTALTACRPITTETITEDITQVAEKLGPLLLKDGDKRTEAADVYNSIFIGEKKYLGVDSAVTLYNGHQYGSLCFELKRFPMAEVVLSEVWDHRKQTLGERALESIASGFKLGQVYLMENKYDAAIDTHRSILDVRKTIFGHSSAEVIESSEILGTVLLSHKQGFDSGFELLRDALASKVELFGVESTTLTSAVRLASLSASHGRFPHAVELFTWVSDQARTKEASKMSAMASASGFAAAGLQYIQQNHRQGNELVQRTIGDVTRNAGEGTRVAQTLAYSQAMLMFLQREGRQFRHIIRQQFNIQKRLHGTSSHKTIRSGEIVAIGTLVDCLLKRTRISEQVDKVNDWLFSHKRGWTLVMRFAMASAVICQQLKLSELADALLKWLYRTQKRLFGRFEQSTLITLAIHHAYHLRNLYKRAKRIPTKDHSAVDPRVFLPRIWPTLTRSIGRLLTDMTSGEERSKIFGTWLPKLMAEWTLYQGYRSERTQRIASLFFTPEMQQSFSSAAFGNQATQPSQSLSSQEDADDEIASRIWTVTSETLENELGRDGVAENGVLVDDDSDLLDFSEILDERATTTERLGSLGNSLIDLTMGEDEEDEDDAGDATPKRRSDERAECRLKELQTELVNETISEEGIDTAKVDYEEFESEVNDG
ncbi:hypothetical protein BDW02DRAFT_574368 [Decorospora gaudefroyi]|uniref:Azaphilone pigments biosynthesis cluster protein L N-terminal domain-containing protein n=1 Tax=Decorospora gaudefroyi TaxID=184978 RepID=A0A6A5JZ46_9PLEO|nr:hypothetical protein BDW02DRAFT_574368 [Decorospora gaudefroyi]